jgi:hypothetical protein
MKFTQTRFLPLRVLLKTCLLATMLVGLPLYAALVWAGMRHPGQGALKGFSLLLLALLCGWVLWRFLRRSGFRGGGPGFGPEPPSVREPRPPGGRPPALSARARVDERQE